MEPVAKGISPRVVDYQYGRLKFTSTLAAGIVRLLIPQPLRHNEAPVESWCEIARTVFGLVRRLLSHVTATTTKEYGAGKQLAPRPMHRALDLARIIGAGFAPAN